MVQNVSGCFSPMWYFAYVNFVMYLSSFRNVRTGSVNATSKDQFPYLKQWWPWTTLGWVICKKGLSTTIHSFSHGVKRIWIVIGSPYKGRITVVVVSGHVFLDPLHLFEMRSYNFQKVQRTLESSRSLLIKVFMTVTTRKIVLLVNLFHHIKARELAHSFNNKI